MLNVYVAKALAGRIFESDTDAQKFCFQYDAVCPEKHAISLSMPVVKDQYDWQYKLHPIFDMNLPEGALAQQLRNGFSKAIPNFNDLTLLKIVGKSQIGRLRFAEPGENLPDIPSQNLDELIMHDGAEGLFEDLMRRFAVHSGISGVQPKVMIRDEHTNRVTHRGATHIVKAWNHNEYPELATNEYFCMRAAQSAKIDVPNFQLSKNGKFLIIERFDLKEDTYLGFEDLCALNAKTSDRKYDGSYENITKRIKDYVSPSNVKAALDQFFKSLALSCAVRNGDAHLKNFGVLYDDAESDVRLSPAYDIITTTVYIPNDTLALTLSGTKRWPNRKSLLNFAKLHCDMSESRARDLLGEVAEGILYASNEAIRHLDFNPNFRAVGVKMLEQWNRGLNHSIHPSDAPEILPIPSYQEDSFSVEPEL